MHTIASLLIAASAAIVLLLGLINLLYRFSGPKLLPRDADTKALVQFLAGEN